MGEPNDISTWSQNDLQKKIRDMFQLKRDIYKNISNCKQVLADADAIIDKCESELRRRGHI